MPTYEEALKALANHQRLKPSQTKQFTNLGSNQIEQFKAVWSTLPDPERISFLANLKKMAEENVLVDFNAIYELATEDPNADVRRVAIGASIDDQSPVLLSRLLYLCANDPEAVVRQAAAERLEGFAYEAEVGNLPDDEARRIEAVLLERVQSETEEKGVRAAALSSVGYFSTEKVRAEIRRALTRPDLKIPAIRAIGRNIDPVWTKTLEEQMGSDDPAIRREAAEAAANYENTVDALADLVDDPVLQVRLAAINSLGQIGGAEARDVLIYCYESSDPTMREAAANALEEIEATEDPLGSLGTPYGDDD
jgi:HEAT repeat protein